MIDDCTHPRHGVPTTYRGVNMRSRTEAHWASFFDALDLPWTYEPFDGAGYLPDFLIRSPRELLVEVKPATSPDDCRQHLPKILRGIGDLWRHDILIAGTDPWSCLYLDFLHDATDWHASGVQWIICGSCDSVRPLPAYQWDDCLHCGKSTTMEAPHGVIDHLWRTSGNASQWNLAA